MGLSGLVLHRATVCDMPTGKIIWVGTVIRATGGIHAD